MLACQRRTPCPIPACLGLCVYYTPGCGHGRMCIACLCLYIFIQVIIYVIGTRIPNVYHIGCVGPHRWRGRDRLSSVPPGCLRRRVVAAALDAGVAHGGEGSHQRRHVVPAGARPRRLRRRASDADASAGRPLRSPAARAALTPRATIFRFAAFCSSPRERSTSGRIVFSDAARVFLGLCVGLFLFSPSSLRRLTEVLGSGVGAGSLPPGRLSRAGGPASPQSRRPSSSLPNQSELYSLRTFLRFSMPIG